MTAKSDATGLPLTSFTLAESADVRSHHSRRCCGTSHSSGRSRRQKEFADDGVEDFPRVMDPPRQADGTSAAAALAVRATPGGNRAGAVCPQPNRGTASHSVSTNADMIRAVNAAIYLRRPLLLTGKPGTGKSTLISKVGTSFRSARCYAGRSIRDRRCAAASYDYDAVGRLQARFRRRSCGRGLLGAGATRGGAGCPWSPGCAVG